MAANTAFNHNASLTLDSNSKPNARRRTVVVVEKKSGADMLTEGLNGVSKDKVIVNGKDLSHTIRGESVLDRSKNLSQWKKELFVSSTISPQRKKDIPKPQKPKWQTVLSILTKNFLLLAVLLWLGQTVWRWTDMIRDNTNSPFVALYYDGRISEVESSLKKIAKMLQVQVEAVDQKIGNEIGIMTSDIRKQIEEKGALLEKELKKLEVRTDCLDKSLTEFNEVGLLSKEEFERFWNELKTTRSPDGSDSDVNLDQIRAFARDVVKKEIEKHAADGLGRVDYALAFGGARVVKHSEPYGFEKVNSWFSVRNGVHANAHKMLELSFGEPGQCFPLQGSSGFVEIRLRTGIIPEAVTLEHVSKVSFNCLFLVSSYNIHFSYFLHFNHTTVLEWEEGLERVGACDDVRGKNLIGGNVVI
ncbi:SUN domain-containing protein 2-like [Elaeis guineensis]|uniref:SUN domain-containing protein 2-like n=1 Tax=Elaeis guineensis var. tenera TaxID=51953 RepID=UPI003C6CF364